MGSAYCDSNMKHLFSWSQCDSARRPKSGVCNTPISEKRSSSALCIPVPDQDMYHFDNTSPKNSQQFVADIAQSPQIVGSNSTDGTQLRSRKEPILLWLARNGGPVGGSSFRPGVWPAAFVVSIPSPWKNLTCGAKSHWLQYAAWHPFAINSGNS